jgi:hypothetical protein
METRTGSGEVGEEAMEIISVTVVVWMPVARMASTLRLVGGELLEGAGGEVAGHDGARAQEQGGAEGGGEAADAGEGGDSNCNRKQHKQEFAAGGAHLAGGDFGGGTVGEAGHG